ncbi:hypothetical protein Moror_5630 [Moniliophthora roreri MCA 2997]|uniref:Retrotransposon gag domain-containing protein n=1 Tax=Moniliophthora roreri (strain MCA 2997) TaxID=1381753 RepID=V2WQH1_MONRO|nr:hypothetical protein Moror_5630 [Moniliophthora roreri MCA 2997]
MTDRLGEFWKNEKMDLLLALDQDAEKVLWGDFLKLRDLRMKERADEYTYQFSYLAKQTGYNDATQIIAFKQGLSKSLVLKIMTRPEGAPTNIKDWMNAAILFNKSYKQAQEYGKTWDEDNGRKPPWNF